MLQSVFFRGIVFTICLALAGCASISSNKKQEVLSENTIVYGIDSRHLDFIAQRLGYEVECLGMSYYWFSRKNVAIYVGAHNNMFFGRRVVERIQASSPVTLSYSFSDGKRELNAEIPIAHGVTMGEIENHFREFIRRIKEMGK